MPLPAEPSHWPAFYFRGKGSLRQASVQLSMLPSQPHKRWDDRYMLSHIPSPQVPLFIDLYVMCLGDVCLNAYMCTVCMFDACRDHKCLLEPMELELHIVASCLAGASNALNH